MANHKKDNYHYRDIIISGLSGVLVGLSFPKPGLWFLGWFGLVGLFLCIDGRDFRHAFSCGFVFGWVFFFFTQYWINNSISHYGGLPVVAGAAIVGLLSAYQALYTGIFAGLTGNALKRANAFDILFIGALWVGLEYIKGIALTGFPWSILGYSQTELLPLMQVADITGIYGVSLFVVLVNLTLYGFFYKRWSVKKALPPLIIIALFTGYGIVRYYTLQEIRPSGYIKVGMVQPNVEQQLKWDPEYKRINLEKLFTMTEELLSQGPDLVIWPETAIPFYFGYEKDLTERLQRFVIKHHLYLLTGAPLIRDIKKINGRYQYITSNSAILLGPDGKVMASYDKIHLVPFGEYVPLRDVLFFINRLVEGIGDFKRGEEYTVFDINEKRFFVLICYEAIFPSLVREFGKADFIVNITNDAWFGTSSGPYQHADIARVRAIEMRRPLVRVANSGISEVVDITGRINEKSKLNTEWASVYKVGFLSSESLYSKIGDLFSYIMIGVSIFYVTTNVIMRAFQEKEG